MWYGRLPHAIEALERLPSPWVDRSTLQELLGVGKRRAQQILAPVVTVRVGRNGLAEKDALRGHLSRLAEGESAAYERRRLQRFAEQLSRWAATPRLPLEAPRSVIDQEFASLPAGIELSAGRITVQFTTPAEALEKLLSLAMAVANDQEGFERRTAL